MKLNFSIAAISVFIIFTLEGILVITKRINARFYIKYLKNFSIIGLFSQCIGLSLYKVITYLAKKGFKYPEYIYACYLLSRAENSEQMGNAALHLEKSANKNISGANYKLYFIYSQLSTKDPMPFLMAAAQSHHVQAQYKLGTCYWLGTDKLEQNYELAHDWFTLASRSGDPLSLCSLGIMYNSNDLTDQQNNQSSHKAYKYIKAVADLDDNLAICTLAQMYEKGRHIEKNLTKSTSLFKQAADNGYVDAMFLLANCYEKGRGIKQNYRQALHWYKMANKTGHIPATLKLADFYMLGHGIKSNPIKAEALLKSAAALGDAYAQFKLANFYDSTETSLQNYEKAYEWYLKAAKQGNIKAQINLAALCLKGEGVMRSESNALFWLESAALNGDQIAQYNLKQLKLFNVSNNSKVPSYLI